MRLEEFDYYLPPELIAQEPLPGRDASRLMVLNRRKGTIEHRHFSEIGSLLPGGGLMVLNDSRVIPARIFCKKADTSGRVEVLLTRRHTDTLWEGLIKPSRRVRPGTRLIVKDDELEILVLSRNSYGTRQLELTFSGDFWKLLDTYGQMPLPPYIKKRLENRERYQTVYAREAGSVAAPTAGLHFTPEIFTGLTRRGIDTTFVTLHVGPGTFRPVKAPQIEEHRMETEHFSISSESAGKINSALLREKTVIAVGTTVVRTIESAYRINELNSGSEGWSDLFIYPGFSFKATGVMITNFHLPRSTLLMLTSAFAGREFLLEAYREAIEMRYRFYSLGDAMLIL